MARKRKPDPMLLLAEEVRKLRETLERMPIPDWFRSPDTFRWQPTDGVEPLEAHPDWVPVGVPWTPAPWPGYPSPYIGDPVSNGGTTDTLKIDVRTFN